MNFLKSQKTIDWSLVVLLNFMWATQVPVVRFIGENNRSIGPIMLAFIPLILSTIIFLPVLWMENKKRNIGMRWRWKDIKYFLVSGIIGIFILQYAYTLGSLKTLAANAGIITLTIPVLVAIFASFMLNEKLNIVRIVSFILAIGGVLLTSGSDISAADFIHGQYLGGNLIFLFACLCCAFYNTYCKVLVEKKYTELEILVYSSIIGSIASIPLLIWVEPFSITGFLNSGKITIFGIFELSIFVFGVASLLFFYVLKRMDVTQAILGNYLLPFFIGLLGVILLSESITLLMIIGGTIIFLSTLMVTVYENDLLAWFRKFKFKKSKIQSTIIQ
jgi:drug/metabolite transporter (DMT)-like permease